MGHTHTHNTALSSCLKDLDSMPVLEDAIRLIVVL
jgi:hypothetical protein